MMPECCFISLIYLNFLLRKITKAFIQGSCSDIDIIVDFERNSRYSLFDLVAMENELKAIFNRDVDLVTHKGIANSRNYLRRENILNSAQTIYESGKTISP